MSSKFIGAKLLPIAVLSLVALHIEHVQANSLAEAMCQTYVPAVGGTFLNMRRSDIPIGIAEKQIYDMNIDDSNMRIFLRKLVQATYQNPDGVEKAIQDGRILKACIRDVRGY